MKYLLEAGADVNREDNVLRGFFLSLFPYSLLIQGGLRPSEVAAYKGHLDVLKVLHDAMETKEEL